MTGLILLSENQSCMHGHTTWERERLCTPRRRQQKILGTAYDDHLPLSWRPHNIYFSVFWWNLWMQVGKKLHGCRLWTYISWCTLSLVSWIWSFLTDCCCSALRFGHLFPLHYCNLFNLLVCGVNTWMGQSHSEYTQSFTWQQGPCLVELEDRPWKICQFYTWCTV